MDRDSLTLAVVCLLPRRPVASSHASSPADPIYQERRRGAAAPGAGVDEREEDFDEKSDGSDGSQELRGEPPTERRDAAVGGAVLHCGLEAAGVAGTSG